jgi:hypothetical protein
MQQKCAAAGVQALDDSAPGIRLLTSRAAAH